MKKNEEQLREEEKRGKKRESLANKFCTKWRVVKFFHQNEVQFLNNYLKLTNYLTN